MPAVLSGRVSTKLDKFADVANIINSANFHVSQWKGSHFTRRRKFHI